MIVYRLAKEVYHKDITGTGARIYGGRWNLKGIPALYACETRALSTLEFLVHTDYDLLPPKLKLLNIQLPLKDSDVLKIKAGDLPKNWRRTPAPRELKNIGQKYLIEEHHLAIKVPSVIIPDEFNIVINPLHQDFDQVKIDKIQTYKIDVRLFNR